MLVSEVATQIRYDGASWMDETNLTEETTVPKCSKLSSVASLIIACVLFAQSASPRSRYRARGAINSLLART